MDEKRPLPLDIRMLAEAMNDHEEGHEWFLEMDTGRLIWHSQFAYFRHEDNPELENFEERDLREIERTPSREAYEDMVDFAKTVEDEGLREKLAIALDGRGAFGRFRRVLAGYPAEEQRWYEAKARLDRRRALEFLDDLGIEPIEPESEPSDAEQ